MLPDIKDNSVNKTLVKARFNLYFKYVSSPLLSNPFPQSQRQQKSLLSNNQNIKT